MSASRASIARGYAAASIFVALTLGAAWTLHAPQIDHQQRERGAALFRGERPLVARLPGHRQPLPTGAVRCINCHQALDATPVGSAVSSGAAKAASRPFASPLTGDALSVRRARHGGPPSVYGAQSLCELLRTGVDPAQVMIPNTMPRYEMTSADCADLWAHLRHAPV